MNIFFIETSVDIQFSRFKHTQIYACINIDTYASKLINIYEYVYIYIFLQIYLYAYMYIHTSIYIYICIFICIFTYMHLYVFTHV
jgi:hypothetical protein